MDKNLNFLSVKVWRQEVTGDSSFVGKETKNLKKEARQVILNTVKHVEL